MKTIEVSHSRFGWLALIYFGSGLCSLMDEVVWVRLLKLILGNTVYASSIVVSVFMGGLALGAFLMARYAERLSRPLKWYAGLEVVVTIVAALMPAALALAQGIYRWIFQNFHPSSGGMGFTQIAISAALLLIPTMLMGSTLPLLSQVVTRAGDRLGYSAGRLYALNTLGATVGCLLSGFVCMGALGVMGTVYLAATVNLLVAFGGWKLAGQGESVRPAAKLEPSGGPIPAVPKQAGVIAWAVFASGLISIGYELIWMRTIELPLGGFTYVFSSVLTIYLLGNVIGAWAGSHFVRNNVRPEMMFGFSLAMLGLFGALYLPWFSVWMQHGTPWLKNLLGSGNTDLDLRKAVLPLLYGLALFLLPSVTMGFCLPMALECWSKLHQQGACRKGAGHSTGMIYGFNTIGAVIGGVITGFVLIPSLGVQKGIVCLGVIGLWSGAVVLTVLCISGRSWMRWVWLGGVGIATAGIMAIPSNQYQKLVSAALVGEPLQVREGTTTTVVVTQKSDGHRLLAIDHIQMAGDDIHRSAQKTLGHLGALIHPDAREVLTFGFATGETTACLALHHLDRLDCVEIAPEVVEEGLKYFRHINLGDELDKKAHLFYMDGKNYLTLTEKRYDIIINDSNVHSTSGSAPLFTHEHFENALNHLKPRGLFITKLHLQGYPPSHFSSILGTFADTFPHMTIWFPVTKPFVFFYLIGSREPQLYSPANIDRILSDEAVRNSLEYLYLTNSTRVLSGYIGDETDVRRVLQQGPINSDYHPCVEYSLDSRTLAIPDYLPGLVSELRQGSITNHIDLAGFAPEQAQKWWTEFELTSRLSDYVLKAHGEQAFLSELECSHAGLRLCPGYPPLLDLQAKCLADITRALATGMVPPDAVISQMDALIKKQRDFTTAYLIRSIALRQKGDLGHALGFGESALKMNPNLAEAHENLAQIDFRLNQPLKAVAAMEQAVILKPENADYHLILGEAYRVAGQTEKAISQYRESLRLNPGLQAARERLDKLITSPQPSPKLSLGPRPCVPWLQCSA